MVEKDKVFTRKKALAIVLFIAAALILLIALKWLGRDTGPDLTTLEGREMFLKELGWEIDTTSEDCRNVVIPESMEGIMQEYNRIQQEQGYDLSKHAGESCKQYSYFVTNYPNCSQTVIVTLYIQGKQIIAGDIHTAEINGFMHGLKRESAE